MDNFPFLLKLLISFILIGQFSKPVELIIFESPDSNEIHSVPFQKNSCFNTSGDLTNWIAKATSNQYYKRYLRPGLNETLPNSPPLQVNISIDMNSMASVDDLNSEYKIILKIDIEWVDERLKHNCSKNPVTMSMESYHLSRIWLPTLGVSNIKDSDSSIIQGDATLILGQLRTDGYIHLRLSLLLNLFCNLDFELFPFDSQECFIKLESRTFQKHDVILAWHDDHPFRNLESFQITGFKLTGYELYNDSTISETNIFDDIYNIGEVSQIMVKLFIKREWHNYFLEIYLPSILFVMISWLSFWMQITAAPARVSLGMTTMLTLVTSSRATRDKLPRIAYIQALDIWIAFCTCFIFLSLIEFAIVSYIYHYSSTTKSAHHQNHNQRQSDEPSSKQTKFDHIEQARQDSEVFSVESFSKENSSTLLHRQNSDLSDYYCSSNSNPTQQLYQMIKKLDTISTNLLQKSKNYSPKNRARQSKTRGFMAKLFCCTVGCVSNCDGVPLADLIDRNCRMMFPLCFAIFNVIYWCTYLL